MSRARARSKTRAALVLSLVAGVVDLPGNGLNPSSRMPGGNARPVIGDVTVDRR